MYEDYNSSTEKEEEIVKYTIQSDEGKLEVIYTVGGEMDRNLDMIAFDEKGEVGSFGLYPEEAKALAKILAFKYLGGEPID